MPWMKAGETMRPVDESRVALLDSAEEHLRELPSVGCGVDPRPGHDDTLLAGKHLLGVVKNLRGGGGEGETIEVGLGIMASHLRGAHRQITGEPGLNVTFAWRPRKKDPVGEARSGVRSASVDKDPLDEVCEAIDALTRRWGRNIALLDQVETLLTIPMTITPRIPDAARDLVYASRHLRDVVADLRHPDLAHPNSLECSIAAAAAQLKSAYSRIVN